MEETKQVVHDSETISPEEFKRLKAEFFEEIGDGFQNVYPSEEDEQEMSNIDEEARSFITMSDDLETVPFKNDLVAVQVSPEQLVILIELIEKYSTNMRVLDYLYDVDGVKSVYEQQTKIREVRDRLDSTLNHYVRVRPFNPFQAQWYKKIGKSDVRKMLD